MTPDSIRGGMERAAVDRQARAARLQDELNATVKEIGQGHQRPPWPSDVGDVVPDMQDAARKT